MSLPQNPSPQLRESNVDDAQNLASLHAVSFAELQRWDAASIRSLMAQPTTTSLALTHNDMILGFIMASFIAGESEILTLAIHPEHRRKGYAKTLIEKYIEQHSAKGLEKIFLEVAANNIAAIHLYQSLGFTIISKRANYYATHNENGPQMIDGHVMSKTF